MKITRIQADNFLGISSIDLKLETPITLIAGKNGMGKSSLQEAIRLAITREDVRDIKLKKEYDKLVHDGAKAGGACVFTEGGGSYGFNMPKGEFTVEEVPEAMRISLYGQRFASMTPDERRTFLFTLTGCRATPDLVRTRLTSRNCDAAKIEAVLPMLRTGFPSACEFATDKASQAKRDWKAQTNATYGSKVAATWRSEKPSAPVIDIESSKKAIIAAETEIAEHNQRQGELTAMARANAESERKRSELKAKVESIDSVRDNLARATTEMEEYEPEVVDMRLRAKETARIGLVHDMARFIYSVDFDEEHEAKSIDLLDEYVIQHGTLAGELAVDQEARNSLPEYERGLEVLQNRVKNLMRDLANAEAAKTAYDALEIPVDDIFDASAELEVIAAKLREAKQRKDLYQSDIRTAEDTLRKIEQADKLTKAAAAFHADVTAWMLVSDALAPDGIPGELLAEALKPINSTLQIAADDTGWQTVKISKDMAITADGRPMQLLSQSEKWRVNSMIAQAISKISGLKILMLDEMDILDIPNRISLLTWLDELATDGHLDTCLIFATMKQLPSGLPSTITAAWIENGTIKQLKVAA